jgi:DNA-binding NarL/FixJ family response regulator
MVANGTSGLLVTAFDLLRQRFGSLSPRQRDAALLLAKGLTNIDVALRLGITVHTVKAHRAEVMRRMEAASFAELVAQLQRLYPADSILTPVQRGPLRIIVVEDDQWYREYLTDNLNAREFSATGVADGAEFSAAWAAQRADIVMLDIELGNEHDGGLAIATSLRKNSGCGIVMVTARGEIDDRLVGLGIGADAYFSKPVNINELVVTLINLGRRLR